MTDKIVELISLFITFFLANVASKYVSNSIDAKLNNKNLKMEYDFQLAKSILELFDLEGINLFVEELSYGQYLKEKFYDMVSLIEMLKDKGGFYNKKLNKQFITYIKTIEEFKVFSVQEFTVSDPHGEFLRMNSKCKPNGDAINRKNELEILKLTDNIEKEFKKLNSLLRKHFPGLYLNETRSESTTPSSTLT